MIWLEITIISILLLTASIFSSIETAFTAASAAKVYKLKSDGNSKALQTLSLIKIKDKVISTFLISYSIVNIIATTLATSVCITLYGDEGAIISSVVMSLLIIIFAEVLPKAIAVARAEKIALATSGPVSRFMWLFTPINLVISRIVEAFCKLFRIDLQFQISAADEVKEIINHHHAEGRFREDKNMLEGVLELAELTVADIMVHRSQMKMLSNDLATQQAIEQVLNSPYSRMPVWRGDKNNVIGILRARDLLRALKQYDFQVQQINWLDFIHEPWFIPENVSLSKQLRNFRDKRDHLAIIVDEYDSIKGIITLEDILEEIVGHIDDEYDVLSTDVLSIGRNRYIINGSTPIRDLNRQLDWKLPDDEANTLAGLIIHCAGRIPEQGESFIISDLKFTISKKIANKLQKILAEKLPS